MHYTLRNITTMTRFFVFGFLIAFAFSCKAQPPAQYSSTNKKAVKAYKQAESYLAYYQFDLAIAELQKAKDADPNFIECYLLQADIHNAKQEWQKAVDEYKKAFALNPKFSYYSYLDCANAELKLGKYEDAKKDYEMFLSMKRSSTKPMDIEQAENGIKSCDFAIRAMANPVPFKPVNMGNMINSKECEYFPNITADESTFLFTRNEIVVDPKTGAKQRSQEDFYISYQQSDGTWSLAKALGPPINTPTNEGAPSLSADGRFLFFAACEGYDGYGAGRQGFGSCDIFFSKKVDGQWSRPANVGAPLNTASWETQPSFSSDGKTLYYVSNRKGGYGNGDIWMSELGPNNQWSTPVNLGVKINTPGNEEAVFIHPDNQTLYFASDGHIGMGGLDLYVCRRDSAGNWGEPQNLGYPINTSGNESGLIVNAGGQYAYYSSTREGGLGCDDMYMFELPKPIRPQGVSYMKGKVYNSKTKKPLGAEFELIDVSTGKTFISSKSDPVTGEFLLVLPINKNYALNVNSPGYCFFSETFFMKEATDPSKPFLMDVPLIPLELNAKVVLKNVFFETAKFDLRPESKAELGKLIAFMNNNPNIKIEISGHTDNVGDKKMNQTLSENRAKSVYNYLVANGIDASRLTYKGYGDTQPVVPNDTPENRQINRRTEFKIIGL